ncbi:cyclase family protein [Thermodesulfobacteriota bacterium]
MSIIDISLTLQREMPRWPGAPPFELHWQTLMSKGDDCNTSGISTESHIGTHVDAPFHFVSDGATIDELAPDTFIGPAMVAHLPEVDLISDLELSSLELPEHTERLLFCTRNSRWWESKHAEFREDFVAMDVSAAEWIVKKGIRLVGVDYLSVEPFAETGPVHRMLLGSGVVIVEGLNLSGVEPGEYEFICLPLKMLGADGAPARAVLRT